MHQFPKDDPFYGIKHKHVLNMVLSNNAETVLKENKVLYLHMIPNSFSPPTQDLGGQDSGCRVGRPVYPTKPPTPCSQGS